MHLFRIHTQQTLYADKISWLLLIRAKSDYTEPGNKGNYSHLDRYEFHFNDRAINHVLQQNLRHGPWECGCEGWRPMIRH